jgi:hypothetical protein
LAGATRLDANQLAGRAIPRAALEPEYQADAEGPGDALESFHTGLVPATLDPRDGGVAGPHPSSEVLLRQAERGSVLDDKASEGLELSQPFLLSSVRGASPGTHPARLGNGTTHRIDLSHRFPITTRRTYQFW